MSVDDAGEQTVDNQNTKKRKKRKFLLPVILVVAILAGSYCIYNVVSGRPFYQFAAVGTTDEAEKKASDYELFGPEDFTVNLADSGQRRYLKVQVTLAYSDKKLQEELTKSRAQIRDLMITTLRGCSALDLTDSKGLESLRSSIRKELNTVLSQGEIKEVYFTDFLVQ